MLLANDAVKEVLCSSPLIVLFDPRQIRLIRAIFMICMIDVQKFIIFLQI